MKIRYTIDITKIQDTYIILIELNKNIIEIKTDYNLSGVHRELLRYVDRRLCTTMLDEIRAMLDREYPDP